MLYVMSDIHGCFDKYQAMLRRIEFSASDTLYVLGDVIDRGPDGVKLLQDMSRRYNVVPLLGNHELTAAMCLPWLMKEVTDQSVDTLDGAQVAAYGEWIANGGSPTLEGLRKLSREERAELLEYIREMELYAEVEAGGRSFVLVHSGLRNFAPERPLDDYELEELLFGSPRPDGVYYPDRTLVFGHTPVRALWQTDRIFHGQTMIDIDCGCAFPGGVLGCLCLDTMEEFYT